MITRYHAFDVDRQMRFFELTGDRALFWGLLHLTMGELCEASEKRREEDHAAGRVRYTAFPGIGAKKTFSAMEVLTPVYRAMEQRANAETEMPRRFQAGVESLFAGAEALISLAVAMKG